MKDVSDNHVIVTLSGPSGSGKTIAQFNLCDKLESVLPDVASPPKFTGLVSHTTRDRRAGERDGVDYHFIDEDRFRRMEEAGEFVETTSVVDKHYGLAAETLIAAFQRGSNVAIVVDPIGVRQIAAFCAERGLCHIAAFIDCPEPLAAERMARRLVDDMAVSEDRSATLDKHVMRIAMALTIEPQWKHMAHYDIRFPHSRDDADAKHICRTIVDRVGKHRTLVTRHRGASARPAIDTPVVDQEQSRRLREALRVRLSKSVSADEPLGSEVIARLASAILSTRDAIGLSAAPAVSASVPSLQS